jgi:hypothetical protein
MTSVDAVQCRTSDGCAASVVCRRYASTPLGGGASVLSTESSVERETWRRSEGERVTQLAPVPLHDLCAAFM